MEHLKKKMFKQKSVQYNVIFTWKAMGILFYFTHSFSFKFYFYSLYYYVANL